MSIQFFRVRLVFIGIFWYPFEKTTKIRSFLAKKNEKAVIYFLQVENDKKNDENEDGYHVKAFIVFV